MPGSGSDDFPLAVRTGSAVSASRRHVLLAGAGLLALPAMRAEARPAKPAAPAPAPATTGSPADTPLGPMDTIAQWAFVTDFDTGADLLLKQADLQIPPSSMTKLMTAYIVYGKLKGGSLKLDQTLPVSEKAWRMQGSKMFVPLGGQVVVEDLIRGMIIQSGNDACIVLAEGIAGSEEGFVALMNARAKDLGLTNSVFMNCTGWPADGHHMSCRDIATLARRIITDFPEYYHYDDEKQYTYNGIVQYNRNPLVQRGLADGLKTGHTDAGGYGVVASSVRGGRRVIMVLNGMPSSKDRVEESQRLIAWAFNSFDNVKLFAAGETVDNAKVWLGAAPVVPLVGASDLVMTLPRAWKQHAKILVDYDGPLAAPIRKGQQVAMLTVSGDGVPKHGLPLLAGVDVGRLALPGRALATLSHFVLGT